MSVATSTPVAPLGARNGAANLAARTLGALAGRNDAVSLRTTLASEGSSTTEATVADDPERDDRPAIPDHGAQHRREHT